MKGAGSTRAPRDRAADPAGSEVTVLDDTVLAAVEASRPEGFTVAQVIEEFSTRGVRLSEATFRKWVQLGLLPRSRRIGRKGKHQGSLGIYPPSTVRRIGAIKRLMSEALTIEEIQRALRYRDEIETIERGVEELLSAFEREIASAEGGRLLVEARRHAGELGRRIEELEKRVVTPLVRAARQRAFAAGAGGGAGDLL